MASWVFEQTSSNSFRQDSWPGSACEADKRNPPISARADEPHEHQQYHGNLRLEHGRLGPGLYRFGMAALAIRQRKRSSPGTVTASLVAKSYRLYRTSNRSRGAVKADGMGHLASREFELLGYAWAHRVPVPEPFAREENAFTMEFVGDADGPAPQLRRTRLEAPEEFARELLAAIDDLAHAGVVHTDLSPFNILVHRGHPVIIDLGKGLRVDRLGASPWIRLNEARTALEHALETLRRYFGRYGVPFETEGLLAQILRDIDRFGVGAYPD